MSGVKFDNNKLDFSLIEKENGKILLNIENKLPALKKSLNNIILKKSFNYNELRNYMFKLILKAREKKIFYNHIFILSLLLNKCYEEKIISNEKILAELNNLDSLINPKFIIYFENVIKVLVMGAKKYSKGNYRLVDDAKERYFAAIIRHNILYMSDEFYDNESNLSHLSHIATNALFLLEF